MTYDDTVIDPLDGAAYATVHEYIQPGTGKRGATALARLVNMPSSTLSNHVNPADLTRELGLKQARAVMLASNDYRILHQLASDLGFACLPLPTLDVVGDLDVLEALTAWQAECGETAQKVRDIYADRRVTRTEVAELRLELIEDFERGLALLDAIKAQAEPD